jgi:TatD DNase family protein
MQSRSMGYIDSHAHIYLPEFDADRNAVIERAQKSGVSTILLPAIDSSTHENMVAVEKQYSNCLSMIGLHPCSVTNDPSKELEIVKNWLQQRSFIAIGEIGLDFYWDKTFTEQQYDAFHQQMSLASAAGLPVCIHSRNATQECIDVVKQYKKVKGVFHCFSGDLEQANEIISIEWMLGIGGVLTFKNAGLDKIISKTGIGSVILETDAPYLAPVPFRGKRNESSYLELVWKKLSELLGKTPEEIRDITTSNCKRLFKLS